MELRTAKIIALFGQVVVLALFTLLPIKVIRAVESKGTKGELFLSCFRCFGGGALLGSYMLHQTPEIRELLQEVLLDRNNIHYPVPEAIAGGGFFLFLFIERLVQIMNHRAEKRDKAKAMDKHLKKMQSGGHVNLALEAGSISLSLDTKDAVVNNNHSVGLPNSPSTASFMSQESTLDIDYDQMELKPSATRSMILLIALSADGIFQGLAVGLKRSNQAVWNVFTAIVSHEFVMAFCLGMELVRASTSTVKGVVVPAIVYALTPAIGTAIGIGLYEAQGSSGSNDTITLVNGILQSVATGVFLYVAFIGILAEELTVNSRMIKLVMILVGFGLMAGLAAIETPKDDPDSSGTTVMPWTGPTDDWTVI